MTIAQQFKQVNPLLRQWNTPFAMPPFGSIEDHHFRSAFDQAIEDAHAMCNAIATCPSEPTFKNTVEALETAMRKVITIECIFFPLVGADRTETRSQLEQEYEPKLAKFRSNIYSMGELYDRVESLWNQQEVLRLTDEQRRVLEVTRREFLMHGATLNESDKNRYGDIRERLAFLYTQFAQNAHHEEEKWWLQVPKTIVKQMPNSLANAMEQAAQDRGETGYVVTLNRSLIEPFLENCPDRELRRLAFLAWTNRGANGNEYDNRAILTEILHLRHECARLLGFDSFADYRLKFVMAKSPATARRLLRELWKPALRQATMDEEKLREYARRDGVLEELEAWDWRYYAEKRREAEFDYSESEVKQYFVLEEMVKALFDCANRLFGLSFLPIEVQLYHKTCQSWEVRRNGQHVAVFVVDYLARASKTSGAWCTYFRPQSRQHGDERPIVVNVCNFAKPRPGEKCLLSFTDVKTLFHEFGHAIHAMLSDVTYQRISGLNVPIDFVELPSQLFEHWMEISEVLSKFALHFETRESIPADLVRKLLASRNFNVGFEKIEYLSSAFVDLEMHSGTAPGNPMRFQKEVLKKLGLPDNIRMRHSSPHFLHVFTNDYYSSSYYSYLWSEALDADAFDAFEEEGGPFNPKTAERLVATILSRGYTKEPDEMYADFRGRLPDTVPLMRKLGFQDPQEGE